MLAFLAEECLEPSRDLEGVSADKTSKEFFFALFAIVVLSTDMLLVMCQCCRLHLL